MKLPYRYRNHSVENHGFVWKLWEVRFALRTSLGCDCCMKMVGCLTGIFTSKNEAIGEENTRQTLSLIPLRPRVLSREPQLSERHVVEFESGLRQATLCVWIRIEIFPLGKSNPQELRGPNSRFPLGIRSVAFVVVAEIAILPSRLYFEC